MVLSLLHLHRAAQVKHRSLPTREILRVGLGPF